MNVTMILNGKEYTRDGISAGDYEEFTDYYPAYKNAHDIKDLKNAIGITNIELCSILLLLLKTTIPGSDISYSIPCRFSGPLSNVYSKSQLST